MAFLTIEELQVSYEKDLPVLQGFSLEIEEGELVSFLGPSGCGKTTTLKTIAGFLLPDQGKIYVNDKEYTALPPHKRNIGLVFQNYALFPHLNIYDNIAFGLRMRRIPEETIKTQVLNALRMVNLPGMETRLPDQLSGGQQQRVGLARAMVINPDLLLLDEPLSNLDAKLRVQMRVEIKRLLAESRITTIYVTHDQEESLVLSDRIVIMNQGKIEQIGTPQEIYMRPRTPFVADFMGFENIFEGHVRHTHAQGEKQLCTVRIGETEVDVLDTGHHTLRPQDHLWIAIRPDSLTVVPSDHPAPNTFAGTVLLHAYRGNNAEYLVETALGHVSVLESEQRDYQPGEHVHVCGKPEDFILITAST
ncbi:ATP-binding cassette domain-containing protein [candidate division KSB3 bacterium]|uniref:ATP-binding cassette domain-containing protein n=1 Tax=candidate division KSB3 bacterium TaxID=2044937 RepID=A0A9D5JTY8_9BACT|nr:ATP-binding cassette domain-containing protein [candidate division KSB3 bacterium]MBD3324189.1 ATP-binding cassette domain-containing protein [candidate division KSB3 bacterium]